MVAVNASAAPNSEDFGFMAAKRRALCTRRWSDVMRNSGPPGPELGMRKEKVRQSRASCFLFLGHFESLCLEKAVE